MKLFRQLFVSCISYALLSIFILTPIYAKENNQLTFLTWSEYIDPDVIKPFEQQYNANVRMHYFDSNDQRNDILVETNGIGYDVILCSDASLRQYVKLGWLASLTEQQIPNLKHIYRKWIDPIENAAGYAVPYFWGTVGIAYRKDLISFKVNSWKHLFEPEMELHKKILMIDDSADTIGMALKYLGYSANSTSLKELNEAKLLLQKQNPHVYAYDTIVLDESSSLHRGNAYLAMSYSGDALTLREINPQIEFVLPKEGGNIWIDYLTVSAASKNKELANAFINFLNEPEIAAKLAQHVYYATPNQAAEKLLPDDFLNDSTIYPSKQALKKSEIYKSLPPRIQKARNNIYSTLRNQ